MTTVSYKAIVAWTLWPGAAILVASGLTSFALDYKSIGRSFSGLTRVVPETGRGGGQRHRRHRVSRVVVSGWFRRAGAPVVTALMVGLFQIPLWAGSSPCRWRWSWDSWPRA
ncbi:hypothetical protein [Lacunisphaera limnophila]|uniref:hypothetical protein n=1 Tax=Lacunisphaera limnophila TaxID=1838286 RepID=UPI00085988FC|nr:hypothetical protein [Lacunisphaera limnophila]